MILLRRVHTTYSFHDFFLIPRLVLKSVCLNFDKSDLKPHWIFYFAISSILFCITGELALIISNYRNGVDIVKGMFLMWCCVTMTLGMIKTLDLVRRSKQLKQFMGELEELFTSIGDESKIRMYLNGINSLIIGYVIIYCVAASIFTIFCFSKAGSVYKNGIYWRFDFMYPMLYPFDPYKHPIFEICYMTHQIAAYFATFGVIAVDSLLYFLISYLCIHFYKFSKKFRRLDVPDRSFEKQTIVHLVEEHKNFIK